MLQLRGLFFGVGIWFAGRAWPVGVLVALPEQVVCRIPALTIFWKVHGWIPWTSALSGLWLVRRRSHSSPVTYL